MLTQEQNYTLTRVGPDTRMGNLMRRYWQPVAATAQLEKDAVVPVKLFGEPLILYRDKRGRIGLLAEACPHPHTSPVYGVPEDEGLRCLYHGWFYNSEALRRSSKDHIRRTSYPVEELGGLFFAYLGPEPTPVLPRYNTLVWDDAVREINGTVIACNWLQVMENLLDPYHVEFLHGRYFAHVLRKKGGGQLEEFLGGYAPKPMKKIAFDLSENGIIERHMSLSEDENSWKIGAPTFFPTTTLVGSPETSRVINFVVPLDDTHTWFVVYLAQRTGIQLPWKETPAFIDVPGIGENDKFIVDTANGQDHMAVVTQGEIARRDLEHLSASDVGITLYRELLMEQIERVERGEEPMNVYQDPDRKQSELLELVDIA